MGYSNIFAAGLAFSVLLGIFYVLYDRLPKEVVDLNTEMTDRYDALASKTATEFDIRNTTYFSDSYLIVFYLFNSGTAILDPDDLSVIVDGVYLDETIYTIAYSLASDERNPGLWDPDEYLRINVTYELSAGNHHFKIFYANGVWANGQKDVIDSSITWTATYTDAEEGTINESCDITGVGAGEDSDYVYLRMNLSGDLSNECIYTWYIDLDGNKNTGVPTVGGRTLLEYPANTTKAFKQSAGVEFFIKYGQGSATLYSQRDLDSMLEEDDEVSFSNPSTNSVVVRVERGDLGFLPTDVVNFSFYAYTVDFLSRSDYAPDP